MENALMLMMNRMTTLYQVVLAAFCLPGAVCAEAVTITVSDAQGEALTEAALYLLPEQPVAPLAVPPTAVMDQIDNEFVPGLLVVSAGTRVSFLNSDNVGHHVYSFSEPKNFELPLYKGDAYPPVEFDQAGLVIIGCNIHDLMLGYILVVDTPYFAVTDQQGRAALDLPPGNYRVQVWSPEIRPSEAVMLAELQYAGDQIEYEYQLDVKTVGKDSDESSLLWGAY